MNNIIFPILLFSTVHLSIAQSIVSECFVSEGYHFNGGRIFNMDEKLYVISQFNGSNDDPKNGYMHQFLIQSYDSNGKDVKTLFNSGEAFYHSGLSDVILFDKHFIIVTGSQNPTKFDSKILVIDSLGNLIKEKSIESFGGLLSKSKMENQFLFIDDNKKEHLFDINLNEYKIRTGESYCDYFFKNDQFYLNSAGKYTLYSRSPNTFSENQDSILTKNQIGGCYDGTVIIPDLISNIILGCKWDPNFSNDVIGMFEIKGYTANELITFSLGNDGHHWVHDAILFNGNIYAVFSSGSNSKAKELGFNDIDHFMWLARISVTE